MTARKQHPRRRGRPRIHEQGVRRESVSLTPADDEVLARWAAREGTVGTTATLRSILAYARARLDRAEKRARKSRG